MLLTYGFDSPAGQGEKPAPAEAARHVGVQEALAFGGVHRRGVSPTAPAPQLPKQAAAPPQPKVAAAPAALPPKVDAPHGARAAAQGPPVQPPPARAAKQPAPQPMPMPVSFRGGRLGPYNPVSSRHVDLGNA